ncbi:MAG: response regulator transcription factor [Proteobacteria bacterium]|uniref:response regulator transcription factor n=1 Tax=Rudaea sp. TaxID=2136325 RepID=UPI003220245F|nr:response regulator transcription factor [Pseudomonadota bacterium]
MPSILIADDHPLVRGALRAATASAIDDAQIAEAEDLRSAIAQLEAHEVDLVLLDLHMPDSGGLAGLVALRTQFPGVIVLVVSAQQDTAVIRRALDFGAAGFVPKTASPEDIAAAIRSVLACGSWVPQGLREELRRRHSDPRDLALATKLASLSEQQFRVLGLVAQGRLNKQIADQLGVQLTTVKAHVSAIFDKLNVRNRTQASMLFRDLGTADDPLDSGIDPQT